MAFISFHFGLLGLHFLSFWPFGASFPFILAFWAFISLDFGLLGLHFLSFWPFGLSFPFIFCLPGLPRGAPPHKLPKTVRFLIKFKQILSAARPAAFCNFSPFWPSFPFIWPFGPSFPFILALWAFISFHFGLLGLHFLSFWPFGPSFPFILSFGPSFPFILAFWGFISFHFGLLGLHFSGFWPFGPSFPFILAFWAFISFHFLLAGAATWGPSHKLPKTVRFLIKFKQILSAARPAAFCNFWPFGLHCLSFGLLGLHFLLFWPCGPSFPFILAFWAFISFHFGLLGLHFPSFCPLGLHFLSFWPSKKAIWPAFGPKLPFPL